MSYSKKVSVILPVYNGEKYLSESLDSIMTQTYRNIEIIVVNDCSTDKTQDILQRYSQKDDRIIVLENEKNMKLPRSLNVGFAHSTGEYLTWTSDDNIYAPTAIERMVWELESYLDVSMVYANYQQIDAEGKLINRKIQSDFNVFSRANIIGPCFLYTRKVKEIVGDYDPTMFLVEDYDYWIRIAKCGKIRHLQEFLYFFRIHNASLGQSRYKEVCRMVYILQEKHFLFLNSLCKTRKERFLLYDRMFYYKGNKNDKELIKYIKSVDKRYFTYRTFQSILSRMRKYSKRFIKKYRRQ